MLFQSAPNTASYFQPWLRLVETSVEPFRNALTVNASSLVATAFSGDIDVVGSLNLFPSPTGTLELLARSSLNGLRPSGRTSQLAVGQTVTAWTSGRINLSDADPTLLPSIVAPFSYQTLAGRTTSLANSTQSAFLLGPVDRFFSETGSYTGSNASLQTQQALHARQVLHANDPNPARVYAASGDLSGLRLYSAKPARLLAGNDITDVAFYLQNVNETSLSVVSAGRDIVAFNSNSSLRTLATSAGNLIAFNDNPATAGGVPLAGLAGDIQIGGPGLLEVVAGRDLDLGAGPGADDGTGVGIASIGNLRNPFLDPAGASLVVAAGLEGVGSLGESDLDFEAFLTETLAGPSGERYRSELALLYPDSALSLTAGGPSNLSPEEEALQGLRLFYLVLRDSGRDFNDPLSLNFGTYADGVSAVTRLFMQAGMGEIVTQSRDIRTRNGGDIHLLAPGGGLTLGSVVIGNPQTPPGIVTETGGNINVFTKTSVDLGNSRIFTLRGGNILIYAETGDIAAGAAAKTVASAPPVRVLINPQTGIVQTDLSGLATGGGIGVLATVAGVEPGDVDLIAPMGVIDAGDAGIRVSGNLNLAAVQVLNASNIKVSGASAGVPAPPAVSAPSLGSLAAASNAAGASVSNARDLAGAQGSSASQTALPPSLITVEVIGYGG